MNGCLAPDPVEALDEVLERIGLLKAINPQTKTGFVMIQRRVARELRGAAAGAEGPVLRRAVEGLDVDWPNLTAGQRDAIFRATMSAVAELPGRATPAVSRVLGQEAPRIVRLARSTAISTHDLSISTSLSQRDERVAAFVRDSNVLFVTDEYGRRRASFSRRAREIVAGGLDAGLGRDDITSELEDALEGTGLGRDRAYLNIVAGSFVGRARSQVNADAFNEAGIERFRFDAVLDEVTSEICRFMHGREFSVRKAVERFEMVSRLTDPDEIKAAMPWGNIGQNDDGEDILYYGSADDPQVIAGVNQFGEGERDAVGDYSPELSESDLEDAGLTMPPLHGNCRSTVVAVV